MSDGLPSPADWLPGEDEALAEIRADEYEAKLDALADEIEPFEQAMQDIAGQEPD